MMEAPDVSYFYGFFPELNRTINAQDLLTEVLKLKPVGNLTLTNGGSSNVAGYATVNVPGTSISGSTTQTAGTSLREFTPTTYPYYVNLTKGYVGATAVKINESPKKAIKFGSNVYDNNKIGLRSASGTISYNLITDGNIDGVGLIGLGAGTRTLTTSFSYPQCTAVCLRNGSGSYAYSAMITGGDLTGAYEVGTSTGVIIWPENNNAVLVTITQTGGVCFKEGTLIKLADGAEKPIEQLTFEDELLTWDFDNGCQSSGKIASMIWPQTDKNFIRLTFSDNSTLDIARDHSMFNATKNKFVKVVSDFDEDDEVITDDGRRLTIISKETIDENILYYNLVPERNMGFYANGVLAGNHFCNIYPIENMTYIKSEEKHGSPYKEFAGFIDKHTYEVFRLSEYESSDLDYDRSYTYRWHTFAQENENALKRIIRLGD